MPRPIVTHASSYANRANLSEAFFGAVVKRYEGTRLGRQELMGELVEQMEGALFKLADIERARVAAAPELIAHRSRGRSAGDIGRGRR